MLVSILSRTATIMAGLTKGFTAGRKDIFAARGVFHEIASWSFCSNYIYVHTCLGVSARGVGSKFAIVLLERKI